MNPDDILKGSFHVKSSNPTHLTLMDFAKICQVNVLLTFYRNHNSNVYTGQFSALG